MTPDWMAGLAAACIEERPITLAELNAALNFARADRDATWKAALAKACVRDSGEQDDCADCAPLRALLKEQP